MGAKRKQSSPAVNNSRKRAKGLQSAPPASPHPHGEIDPEKLYTIRNIIDERRGEYRIDWEDDPKTGERFEPTWEPKANVTEDAVKEWNEQKARRPRQSISVRPTQAAVPLTPAAAPSSVKRGKGRPRKVIDDSSPEVSPKLVRSQGKSRVSPQQLPGAKEVEAAPQDTEAVLEIVESQPADQGADVQTDSPLFEPIVAPSDPPSSYVAGDYQPFLSSSQSAPLVEDVQPATISPAAADSEEQSRSIPVNFGEGASRVIPDSQTIISIISSAIPAVSSSSGPVGQDAAPKGPEAVTETPGAPITSVPDFASAERTSQLSVLNEQHDPPRLASEPPADRSTNRASPQAVSTESQAAPEPPASPSPAPIHALQLEKDVDESQSVEEIAPSPQEESLFIPIEDEPRLADLEEPSPTAAHLDNPTSGNFAPGAAASSVPSARRQTPALVDQDRDIDLSDHTQLSHADIVNHSIEASQQLQEEAELHIATQETGTAVRRDHSQLEEPASQQAPTSFQQPAAASSATETSSFPFQTQLPRPGSGGLTQTPHITGSSIQRFSALPGRASSQPVGNSSPPFSSPIASVPLHSIGAIGESAPPRPTTPSSPPGASLTSRRSTQAMDATQSSNAPALSLKEKMKLMKASKEQWKLSRQTSIPTSAPSQDSKPSASLQPSALPLSQPPKAISSLIAEEQSRRSPSAIPAVEVPVAASMEDQNTSERYETLMPQALVNGPRKSVSGPTLSRQPSKLDPQLPHSYMVPIALLGHQRDQYVSLSKVETEFIERFLATSSPDVYLIRKAEHLMDQKRQIALHPDLVNAETMTPYDVRPEQEAQWYVDCSVKFRFLKELLHVVRDQSLHIAIVVQSGRIVDMLDKFLVGINVQHRRTHELESANVVSEGQGLMVTLASVRDELRDGQASPADLVIALDPAVSANCLPVRAFKGGEKDTPLATLVVPFSIEHLEQSISTALPERSRLRTLVSGFDHYRHDAGTLEDEQLGLAASAKALADYLTSHESGQDWPIPTLAALENLDSQTESDIDLPATQDEQALEATFGTKRSHDVDDMMVDSDVTTKKARIEAPLPADLPTTVNLQDLDLTHISDSVTKATQALPGDMAAVVGLVLSETEQSLRRMLHETQQRLDEHVETISQVQFKNEELRIQLVTETQQRKQSERVMEVYVNRIAATESRYSSLREELVLENTKLKHQLEEARTHLADHSVPERAEIEAVRLKAELAEAEKVQAEQRLEALAKNHEFLRDQYQTRTSDAQAMDTQVTELQSALDTAQTLASGEQAKLRQMGYDAQSTKLRDENARLKIILVDRDAAVKFRDEEIAKLKEAARGRMGTRGTSVPRSPRLGSPMKIIDGASPRGRASRQGSPTAGELKGKSTLHLHPLRYD
ncbi:hypothetical protein LTR56_016938 [Elasticomyces elasticus]|nr:hypothetical protein LTR56_016938 [Elasticomyces elasticus]KAK3640434.1 hypothetical protein LTR22_016991 [Elasticomyces elasticus]KAK4931187.1 hypothetical protein LTR49_002241 [Elasticomyces elasticus]KAK5767882.1 hypothetical protein LTS12_002038 [Elasticomyces elasticus]